MTIALTEIQLLVIATVKVGFTKFLAGFGQFFTQRLGQIPIPIPRPMTTACQIEVLGGMANPIDFNGLLQQGSVLRHEQSAVTLDFNPRRFREVINRELFWLFFIATIKQQRGGVMRDEFRNQAHFSTPDHWLLL